MHQRRWSIFITCVALGCERDAPPPADLSITSSSIDYRARVIAAMNAQDAAASSTAVTTDSTQPLPSPHLRPLQRSPARLVTLNSAQSAALKKLEATRDRVPLATLPSNLKPLFEATCPDAISVVVELASPAIESMTKEGSTAALVVSVASKVTEIVVEQNKESICR